MNNKAIAKLTLLFIIFFIWIFVSIYILYDIYIQQYLIDTININSSLINNIEFLKFIAYIIFTYFLVVYQKNLKEIHQLLLDAEKHPHITARSIHAGGCCEKKRYPGILFHNHGKNIILIEGLKICKSIEDCTTNTIPLLEPATQFPILISPGDSVFIATNASPVFATYILIEYKNYLSEKIKKTIIELANSDAYVHT